MNLVARQITAQSQRNQRQRRGESRHQNRIQTVERALYHAVVHVQPLHLLQVVVVADEQHTVTGRDTEQRDETDNCRNAYFAGRDDKGKNAADQCQRQVQQDHAGLLDAAELVVKQQENNDNTHERCQRQYTAGSLFAFELSAILDVVAFGQLDSGVYLLLNIIYNTAQVTVGNVGGDNDFPFYIFAVDRVRAH